MEESRRKKRIRIPERNADLIRKKIRKKIKIRLTKRGFISIIYRVCKNLRRGGESYVYLPKKQNIEGEERQEKSDLEDDRSESCKVQQVWCIDDASQSLQGLRFLQ